MDGLYDLPFTRYPHPSYDARIPAYETVKHSIVTMRGCFGGCSFCSITEHEGRVIQSRSEESVLREVRALRRMDGFSGVISDVGGPTANMYQMKCKDERIEKACRRLSCVHPGVCENLVTDHGPLVQLLSKVRKEKGVKKAFIASGVRYDLAELSPEFVEVLAEHHTGGQLSVAPEHVDEKVLDKMKKPGAESYERFAEMFACASEKSGKNQHLVPYYISGHPGSTTQSMIELALYLKKRGLRPRQVQDFIPTPMSMATSMYVTGLDPFTQEPVYVAKDLREKRMQKALLQYWDIPQHDLAREALIKGQTRRPNRKHPPPPNPPRLRQRLPPHPPKGVTLHPSKCTKPQSFCGKDRNAPREPPPQVAERPCRKPSDSPAEAPKRRKTNRSSGYLAGASLPTPCEADPRRLPSAAMNLLDLALQDPDALAVHDGTRSRSWAELVDRAYRVAHLLRDELGLQPNDHAAILMGNRVEYPEILLGALFAGIWITPVNWHLSDEEVGYVLRDSTAGAVFADPELAGKVDAPGVPCLVADGSLRGSVEHRELRPALPR